MATGKRVKRRGINIGVIDLFVTIVLYSQKEEGKK